MIYFSQLQGKRIVTEDDIIIGKLEDIIFLAVDKPLLTKWVVRTVSDKKIIIPNNYFKKLNNKIIFSKDYEASTLAENELYIVKNLLDKQIIDIKGNKIIRVNDIAIQDKGELYIAGVDVGILGILRRLRLENFFYHLLNLFTLKISSRFLSWADIQSLELEHGQVKMKNIDEKLKKIRPEDLADYLEKTNVANVRRFIRMLDEKRAAEIIAKLNLSYKNSLFVNIHTEKAAKILTFLSPDEAADILLTLSKKRREEIMNIIPPEDKEELNYLLGYSITQIGKLMTTEFILVYPDNTVKEVIDKIRRETSDFITVNNIYVVNKQNQLIGVFNLHELLREYDLSNPVYKFMIHDVIFLYLTSPVEVALNRMIKYSLLTIPVVNKNKEIIGIVSSVKVIASVLRKNYQ